MESQRIGSNAPEKLEAVLSYLSPDSETAINYPSVAGGPTERNTGVVDARKLILHDARRSAASFSLDVQGFELVKNESRVTDFSERTQLEELYAAEVRELVMRATGAKEVIVFDFTQRSDDEQLRETRLLRDPALNVHNDYTPRSAIQRLRDIEGGNAERRLQSRFSIVNVWRSAAGRVQTTPIALCDARSVDVSQLVSVERRAKDRIGEIYQFTYDPGNRWYYFSDMDPGEALLIKTYDSETSRAFARFTPHCAFVNLCAAPGAPPRHSIEARTFAFY